MARNLAIPLDEARRRGEAAIETLLASLVPGAGIFSFGAVDLDLALLAIWVRTPTDAERDRLARDPALQAQMRRLLADAGYPRGAAQSVAFAFESDETVTRDYDGNWWAVIK